MLLGSWGMQGEVCVPIARKLPGNGSRACKGGACGLQQESREVGMQSGRLWCPIPVRGPNLGG